VGGVLAIATLALNLQWGSTGLFNIGIGGFMAVGAYTAAILTTPLSDPPTFLPGHLGGFHLPFIVGILAAMAVAGFLGLLIALPTLRLRADYLAIATIGLAEIIRLYILNALTLTSGTFTIGGVPRPDRDITDLIAWFTGGETIEIGRVLSNVILFVIIIAVILLVYWVFERSTRSPWGRVLKGIREDEDAAAALGKNTFRYKVQVFVIGSMIMGAAGALFVSWFRVAETNTSFVPADTFLIWIMLIIGGSGNNKGAILGAFLVWGLFSLTIVFTGSLASLSLSIGVIVFIAAAAGVAGFLIYWGYRLAAKDKPGPAKYAYVFGGVFAAMSVLALLIFSFGDFVALNFSFIRLAAVGAVLIILMMFRPQGILGEERVISKMG
jgi:branched-chain amino acid transport system permease protein